MLSGKIGESMMHSQGWFCFYPQVWGHMKVEIDFRILEKWRTKVQDFSKMTDAFVEDVRPLPFRNDHLSATGKRRHQTVGISARARADLRDFWTAVLAHGMALLIKSSSTLPIPRGFAKLQSLFVKAVLAHHPKLGLGTVMQRASLYHPGEPPTRFFHF